MRNENSKEMQNNQKFKKPLVKKRISNSYEKCNQLSIVSKNRIKLRFKSHAKISKGIEMRSPATQLSKEGTKRWSLQTRRVCTNIVRIIEP